MPKGKILEGFLLPRRGGHGGVDEDGRRDGIVSEGLNRHLLQGVNSFDRLQHSDLSIQDEAGMIEMT